MNILTSKQLQGSANKQFLQTSIHLCSVVVFCGVFLKDLLRCCCYYYYFYLLSVMIAEIQRKLLPSLLDRNEILQSKGVYEQCVRVNQTMTLKHKMEFRKVWKLENYHMNFGQNENVIHLEYISEKNKRRMNRKICIFEIIR